VEFLLRAENVIR